MSQVFTYKTGSINLEKNGIVYYRASADDVYDVADMKAMLDLMEEANQGKPFKLLMLLNEHEFLMTKEARNFFNEYEKAARVIIAEAVVINSISTRILYNLLTLLHKPQFPFKAFTNEDDAVKWLLKPR